MSFALPNALLRNFILAVGICATFTAHAAQSTVTTANPMLLTARWELVKWPGHSTLQGMHGQPVTIDFDNTTQPPTISGFSGCNRFSGSYASAKPEQLTLSQLSTTRMTCPKPFMQTETEFLEALRTINQYNVSGTILQLKIAKGQTLSFYPREKANATAKIKYIYVAPHEAQCIGVGPTTCLLVRENETKPWEYWYTGIEGFDFIPGIAYRLRIVEETLANPPADGSSVRWTLNQVLEARHAN